MASDKAMSSRLLTMKFMQRGVANSPTASLDHQRASKRQRLSNGAPVQRHSAADIEAMQAAIADEETKRLEVVERLAAEKGDTRWVLSVRRPMVQNTGSELNVSVAGFADIDQGADTSEDEDDQAAVSGRMRYGKFVPTADAEEDHESNSDSEGEYNPTDMDKLIAEGKAAASRQRPSYGHERMPTSISGGGSKPNSNTPKKDFTCYKCGQSGHMARNCTNR